jgi:hypothetical protein
VKIGKYVTKHFAALTNKQFTIGLLTNPMLRHENPRVIVRESLDARKSIDLSATVESLPAVREQSNLQGAKINFYPIATLRHFSQTILFLVEIVRVCKADNLTHQILLKNII